MKHLHITFLLAMLMSMMGTKASAYDFAVENSDGVTIYYINLGNNQVAVTYKSYNSITSSYEGYESITALDIPETVTYNNQEYSVRIIDASAFCGCSGLKSITIPNSVTSIGMGAFFGCI